MTDLGSKSKTSLDANSEPPEPLIFFIDRGLGNKIIATALRHEGVRVEVHSDHFQDTAPDVEWLTEVGTRGWVVLTKDNAINRRTAELTALINARVRTFVFVDSNLPGVKVAQIIVAVLPQMLRFATHQPGPFVVKIYKDGSIKRIYPTDD